MALESQQRRYAGDWVYSFVEGDGEEFAYETLLQQALVFVVPANPKPDHRIPLERTESPIVVAHAHGIGWLFVIYTLEMQARMVGVRFPGLISLSRALPHPTRKARIELPELGGRP